MRWPLTRCAAGLCLLSVVAQCTKSGWTGGAAVHAMVKGPMVWCASVCPDLRVHPNLPQIRQQQAAWRQQYNKFCAAAKQGKHRCVAGSQGCAGG